MAYTPVILLTLLLFKLLYALKTDNISTRWKDLGAMNQQWINHDNYLHKYLSEFIPEALPHTGSASFDHHLKGVQSILRKWKAPEYLCDAGLFHSIYGTEGFQGYKLDVTKRPAIRKLLGEKTERLVWIFCMVDRLSVDNTLYESYSSPDLPRTFYARDELGKFPIMIHNEEEWLDFIELTLADWLEQVEGAAEKVNPLYGWQIGEAWSYRREAYQQMAIILSQKRKSTCEEMHTDIYKEEPLHTRQLHQKRTPPMTQAAKEARDAIQSIHL